ncbi:unnamed protein product [Brachionus calyciflorus]|uniref:Uncharacterized protein n=1 Tax=Brachionus calyciflorus TaxID=104777 RepID=A0A814KLX8_9BILA|nr:unnamed protein product [Brachionus calyciflorus]
MVILKNQKSGTGRCTLKTTSSYSKSRFSNSSTTQSSTSISSSQITTFTTSSTSQNTRITSSSTLISSTRKTEAVTTSRTTSRKPIRCDSICQTYSCANGEKCSVVYCNDDGKCFDFCRTC